MLRLQIDFFKIICLIFACMFAYSCGFVDLRQINYVIEPDTFDAVLERHDSPISIKFDTEMNKKEAEGIIQVSSDLGTVKGDFSWIRNNLYFTPVAGWTAGIRYSLFLNGTIRSLDGRELRIQDYVSFYAINKKTPPVIEEHYPADGESIGTNNFVLELFFSVPMNRLSVESSLSINGIGNKFFEWSDDNKTLKVIAEKPLAAWTSYNWNIKDSAQSEDGVPLPKQYSGSFTTNLDQILPEVVNIYPVEFSNNGLWVTTGRDFETGLSLGDGIAIDFNKPMDENVLRSIRFEPALTGRAEMLAENKIVYIFTRNPEPETEYTLIISADTRDIEGLKIGEENRFLFKPDIPYLSVLSVNNDNSFIKVNEGTGYVEFSIWFSAMLNNEEKQAVTQKIIFSPYFPKTLAPIALQFISWPSNDRIIMRWEGLEASNKEARHYYVLTIPGGRGGINFSGLYMKEDFKIYLEAIND